MVERLGFIARLCRCLADARVTVAALHVSRAYQPAVRHMRNDAMRHPILSPPFSCGIAMEPIRVRGSLRRDCVRRIRACNSRSAYATATNPSFDAARENIFACLSHLCARVKLDLFAAALAQLLAIMTASKPSLLEGV